MADERPAAGRPSAPDPEIHDDDELADALAAELDHLAATGAVPIIRMPAPQPDAERTPASPVPLPDSRPQSVAASPSAPARAQTPSPPPRTAAPGPAPTAAVQPVDAQPSEPGRLSRSAARAAPEARHTVSPTASPAGPTPHQHAAHRAAERAAHRTLAAESLPRPPALDPRPAPDGSSSPRTGAHAALPPAPLTDPLDATGPLPIPPPLYEAWEQSLRQIGRRDWEEEEAEELDEQAGWASFEEDGAPTATISRAELGPLPPDPLAEPTPPLPSAEPVSLQDLRAARAERRRERSEAVVPPAGPADHAPEGVAAGPYPADEDEGLDEVQTDIPSVHATDTAAIALPPLLETSAVPAAVVPAPAPTGSGGTVPLLQALLWVGALTTPLALLIGFAVPGAGPGAGVAVVLGALLGLPAAARLVAAAVEPADGAGVPTRVLGRAGVAVSALLIAARLAAAVLALLAVADVATAFAARTGVGGDSGTAGVVAVLLVGLLALAAAAAPGRLGSGLLLTFGGAGVIGTLVVLTVFASAAAGVPAGGGPQSVMAAGGAGFAFVALLLVATAPDLSLGEPGRGPGGPRGVAVAVAGLLGALLLAAAVSIAARAGGGPDPGTALVGALADATSATATGPVGAIMLLAALTLPALLLRSAGAAAAALLPGRSAWLGAAAGGLLSLALALGALAAGIDLVQAFAAIGPLVGVPVAVWAGIVTAAPSRLLAVHSRSTIAVAAAIAVLVGWLLTDGLGSPGAHSALLDGAGMPASSALRGSPAFGLAAAFVLGVVAALLGRLSARRDTSPAASRMRSEHPQPVDSVEE